MRAIINIYKNFFLRHDQKIFITLGLGGSVAGGQLAYQSDMTSLDFSFNSIYMNTFSGTVLGGIFGLGTALLLEPVIIPCTLVTSSVYFVNKLISPTK